MIAKTQLLIVLGRKMHSKLLQWLGCGKGLSCGRDQRPSGIPYIAQKPPPGSKASLCVDYWKYCKHYFHFQVSLPGKRLMPSYQISVGGRQCHVEQSNHVNIFICIIIHLLSIFYLLYELMCRNLFLLWCWFFLSENKISSQELRQTLHLLRLFQYFPDTSFSTFIKYNSKYFVLLLVLWMVFLSVCS